MNNKKWRFRWDILGHYINDSSNNTFQDAENRLNYLEEKENQPDMREKVREYISELDTEYDRCIGQAESILAAIGDYDEKPMHLNYIKLVERAEVLMEVKNDLQSRLEELV